jgi:hypothetical protein
MRPDRLLEQVTGILVRAEIPFEFHEDGEEIGISADETVLFLRSVQVGQVRLLTLQADLAVGIDLSEAAAAGLYLWLSQRNAEDPLVRYTLHEGVSAEGEGPHGWVSAEWELVAGDLDASQLITSIERLVERASTHAAPLAQLFGGSTPADVREECDAFNRGELDIDEPE